jgi:hypothetical protein
VHWFGLGERTGGRTVSQDYKKFFGDRYILFGGQSFFYSFFGNLGADRVNDPGIVDNPEFKNYLRYLDRALAGKEMVGVGELFVNNLKTFPKGGRGIKIRIDGPAIRSLFELVANRNAFLTFHMESDPDAVEQLETLAASNRKGRIILNHCGVTSSPQLMDRLFAANPNIFCEFSSRYEPTIPGVLNGAGAIFDGFGIRGEWKDVIVKHADRFMVGTDVNGDDGAYNIAIKNVRSGLLANLPLDVAQAVAYGNAKRLFNLH